MNDIAKQLADYLLGAVHGGFGEAIEVSETEVERYNGKWAVHVEFDDENGDTFGAYLVIEDVEYL